ncbi:pilus assembly protein TadG-related protein [Sphingomonas sp. LHG3406-1]|uniref:pilus assembly protein TadG-related protein n=1 Tax=Sphingomonas sp. LHG3406-1 TaxID=2804617 RepID=UPI002613D7AC|nr:pilus assembly protein TadG-related protein [Sphingomonas sp. LHG3406-1]
MLGQFERFIRTEKAAIAPTAALAIFALVASGGIAFDYARLAAMDTELQQAADQAALAAATQLDRTANSQTNAIAAINNSTVTDRLAVNATRFANDDLGTNVEFSTTDTKGTASTSDDAVTTHVTFCSSFDDSKADRDEACVETTSGAQSRFVMVTTTMRTAKYAFTPIVAVFGGTVSATAVAGVESSICNVAPLLVCAPSNNFPADSDVGKGLRMKTAGGNSWAPGNYGYLDFGNGNPAVLAALLGNGLNGCQSTDDDQTEPGNKNATDAVNTRLDVYAGLNKNDAATCVPSTGSACPAKNTRKDMTLTMTYTIRASSEPASSPDCGTAAGGRPQDATGQVEYSDWVQTTPARQFGRDTCHYTNTCAMSGTENNFGDGNWDREGYLSANHGVSAATVAASIGGGATAATLTRYQVYKWELANAASGTLGPRTIATGAWEKQGQNYKITKQCAFNQPRFASAAADTAKDRRVLPVVSANCANLTGKGGSGQVGGYTILRVFDVFITEPSLTRTAAQTGVSGASVGTDEKEIYGEIIGPATPVGGGSGFQYYSRNRPYLVR